MIEFKNQNRKTGGYNNDKRRERKSEEQVSCNSYDHSAGITTCKLFNRHGNAYDG